MIAFAALGWPSLSSAQTSDVFPWRFVKLADLETEHPGADVREFRAVTVDGSGTVSLLDLVTMRRDGRSPFYGIHQFGIDGKWIRNVGRQGEGPGEFLSPYLIDASFDGELILLDSGRGNLLNHLDAGGKILSSFRINTLNNNAISFASDDRIWVVSVHPERSREGFYKPWEEEIFLIDRSGNTIWTHKYTGITNQILIPHEDNRNMAIPFPNPAVRMAHWTFDDEGTAWILSPDYDLLTGINPEGIEVAEIQVTIPPVSLSREEVNVFIDERLKRLRNSEYEPPQKAAIRIAPVIRQARNSFAPVQRFWWVGPDGFLVDRVPVDMQAEAWCSGQGRYLALFPDGTVSEETEGPGGLVAVSNGYAISMQSGVGDLPQLVLYRIEHR